MFSSADDISIALAIAGDRKHFSLAVAPIVLTTSGTCSGGASRIDGHRHNTVFPTPDIRCVAHQPLSPRGGGDAEAPASPPFNLFKRAAQGLNLLAIGWRFAQTPSDGLLRTSPTKNGENDVLSILTQNRGWAQADRGYQGAGLLGPCMNSPHAAKSVEIAPNVSGPTVKTANLSPGDISNVES